MEQVVEILKSLGLLPVKIVVNLLNVFPSSVREAVSIRKEKRTRDIGSILQGQRTLRLGCAIIAKMRGVVFQVHQKEREKFDGIWTEDFEEIIKKWSL